MKIPDSRESFKCKHCLSYCYHKPIHGGQIESNSKSRKTFNLFKCERCGNLTLTTYLWEVPGSMMGDSFVTEIKRFPPEIYRNKPDWYQQLDKEYTQILNEVYEALDNFLFSLASSGVRTAIEKILNNILGDIGGFEKKLKTLLEQKVIDKTEHELLEALIEAGSASAHRGFIPDEDLINHMMEITEHLFYELCIRKPKTEDLVDKSKLLRESTPKRKKV